MERLVLQKQIYTRSTVKNGIYAITLDDAAINHLFILLAIYGNFFPTVFLSTFGKNLSGKKWQKLKVEMTMS